MLIVVSGRTGTATLIPCCSSLVFSARITVNRMTAGLLPILTDVLSTLPKNILHSTGLVFHEEKAGMATYCGADNETEESAFAAHVEYLRTNTDLNVSVSISQMSTGMVYNENHILETLAPFDASSDKQVLAEDLLREMETLGWTSDWLAVVRENTEQMQVVPLEHPHVYGITVETEGFDRDTLSKVSQAFGISSLDIVHNSGVHFGEKGFRVTCFVQSPVEVDENSAIVANFSQISLSGLNIWELHSEQE